MERCQARQLCLSIICPSTSNVPFCASSKPRIISTVVVLPLPVAPINPTVLPAEILRLIPFNAVRDAFG